MSLSPKRPKPCLNGYCQVALTSTRMKSFESLVKPFITCSLPDSLDPQQFSYWPQRSTDDAIASWPSPPPSPTWTRETHTWKCCSLTILPAFNTIVPSKFVLNFRDPGLNIDLCYWIWTSWQDTTGLEDRHHHILHPESRHWHPSGLRLHPSVDEQLQWDYGDYGGETQLFQVPCGSDQWVPDLDNASFMSVKAGMNEKTAEHITRKKLASMEDLYTQRCRKKSNRIIKDPNHPSHKLFCLLLSGKSCTNRLRDSLYLQAIRLLNSTHYSTHIGFFLYILHEHCWRENTNFIGIYCLIVIWQINSLTWIHRTHIGFYLAEQLKAESCMNLCIQNYVTAGTMTGGVGCFWELSERL